MKSFVAAAIAAAASIAGAVQAQSIAPPPIERVIAINDGDTLGALLRGIEATPEEVEAIAAVLGDRARDGSLEEGQALRILLAPERGARRLRPVRVTLESGEGVEAVAALSVAGRYVLLQPWLVLDRPPWLWPPGRYLWALAPGTPSALWTWEGWPAVPSETVRITPTRLAPLPAPRPLPWLQTMSAVTTSASAAPPWPRMPPPDFRIPAGRSRFSGQKNLEPPRQFVRWSDRIETVVSDNGAVSRRCRAAGIKVRPGVVMRGCAYRIADRCFIVRIDDPGVARHELAHCNGWKHPEP